MESSSAISSLTPALQPYAQPRPAEREQAADAKQDPAKERETAKVSGRTEDLPEADQREIEELKRRDKEVRAHEMAHKMTAGQYARGGASFDYKLGPDGKRYAVGGEVSIDISREADPQSTLEKARTIRRAALAPADPSGQDRRIASRATMMMAQAQQEIMLERMEATIAKPGGTATPGSPSDEAQDSRITATGRRAVSLFKSVESATLAAREDPFDQFI